MDVERTILSVAVVDANDGQDCPSYDMGLLRAVEVLLANLLQRFERGLGFVGGIE